MLPGLGQHLPQYLDIVSLLPSCHVKTIDTIPPTMYRLLLGFSTRYYGRSLGECEGVWKGPQGWQAPEFVAAVKRCFSDLEDPRIATSCDHLPIDILAITMLAVICGADDLPTWRPLTVCGCRHAVPFVGTRCLVRKRTAATHVPVAGFSPPRPQELSRDSRGRGNRLPRRSSTSVSRRQACRLRRRGRAGPSDHTCMATAPANSIAASDASAMALRVSASTCSGLFCIVPWMWMARIMECRRGGRSQRAPPRIETRPGRCKPAG